MRGRVVALDRLGPREAAALMVHGRLDDFLLEDDGPRPGTIYRAVADRPMKGQGGIFLRTPEGMAFLRQVKGVRPGQELLVQVTGYAEPGKAIPVTGKLLFKSRYAIVTPAAPGLNVSRQIRDDAERDRLLEVAHAAMEGAGMGLILRSGCEGADEAEIDADIRAMAELAGEVLADDGRGPEKLLDGDGPHALAWRDWTAPASIDDAPGAFARHDVEAALAALAVPEVALPGGGGMAVEPTRALVAVDINTGGDTGPAAGLRANLAAAKELPRQLRLRGLGGQVVLDLAPMGKKDRRQMESALRAAFRRDPVETALVGWTPLGHYELQRKRDRVALSEVPG